MTRPARDTELVQIVDASLADATARAGPWLACRPGCTPCCHGVFAISALDAARLRDGLAALARTDPPRAAQIRARATASWLALAPDFPGDPAAGVLGETEQDQARFEDFANDAPCPALDPDTGRCDLYTARPMTCRVFGPPVLSEHGLGMCELCFVGAPEAEILAAAMHLVHDELEDTLNAEAESARGHAGSTIIAYALAHST